MSKKSIIKGTLVLSITGVIIRFLGFLFKIILSRKIGSVEIGTFQLTLPVITLCHAVSISGIELTISKKAAYTAQRQQSVNSAFHCCILSVLLGTICGIILFMGAGLIAKFYLHNENCIPLLRAAAFSLPFTCIHSMFYSYNIGKERTAFPAISQLLEQAVRILFIFYAVGHYKGAMAAMAASIVAELCSCGVCGIFLIGKKISLKHLNYSGKEMKEIIKLSFPVTLNRLVINFIQSLEVSLTPLMLELYGMTSEGSLSCLGIVSGMALPVILLPSTLINSYSLMILPSIVKNRNSRTKILNYSVKTLFLASGFGIICTVFFMFAGGKLAALLFGNQELLYITGRLSIICPFVYINVCFRCILNSLDKSFIVLINNMISETVCLFFIVFLIPKFGINAYISGITACQITGAILNVRSVFHTLR